MNPKKQKMKNISKNVFLNTLACPSLGWLLRHDTQVEQLSPELTLGEQFRIEQGAEIGRRAHGLYPKGILISRTGLTEAAEETEEHISKRTPTIFEATFLVDGYVAKADILIRKGSQGWTSSKLSLAQMTNQNY